MRRILIGSALTLVALPAWALTSDEKKCNGDLADVGISGCTAVIQLGRETKPNLAIACYNRGNDYSDQDLYDQAIADYTKAIKLDPKNPHYILNRGLAYRSKGDNDQAIADYTEAITLKPDYADAYNSRAWAYHEKGADAQGLPDAEKAVALAPKDAAAIETRAEIYEKLGQSDKAIADYRMALTLDPSVGGAQDGLKRLGATP
jgi:tetratricopeptide (TPR) repeat protein